MFIRADTRKENAVSAEVQPTQTFNKQGMSMHGGLGITKGNNRFGFTTTEIQGESSLSKNLQGAPGNLLQNVLKLKTVLGDDRNGNVVNPSHRRCWKTK